MRLPTIVALLLLLRAILITRRKGVTMFTLVGFSSDSYWVQDFDVWTTVEEAEAEMTKAGAVKVLAYGDYIAQLG